MHIEVYKEFVTLVIHESFSSAAKELYISQPTLSRHISSLEKELGFQLIRSLSPFRLTVAGKTVFDAATRISGVNQFMKDKLSELSVAGESTVLIDARGISSLEVHLLSIIDRIAHSHPTSQFELHFPSAGMSPLRAVEKDYCDMAFTFNVIKGNPGRDLSIVGDGILSIGIPAATGKLVFAVPKRSPLAQKEKLSINDLRNEVFLNLANSTHADLTRSFSEICRVHFGFEPHFELVKVSKYEEFYFYDRGDKLYLLRENSDLPESSIRRSIDKRMKIVPLVLEEDYWIETRAIYRDSLPSPIFQDFLEALAA